MSFTPKNRPSLAVAADVNPYDAKKLDAVRAANYAFEQLSLSIARNPKKAPILVALTAQLNRIGSNDKLAAIGIVPGRKGPGFFSFRVGNEQGTLDVTVIVPCNKSPQGRRLALSVTAAPVSSNPKIQVPFNPDTGSGSVWTQSPTTIALLLAKALRQTLNRLTQAPANTDTQETEAVTDTTKNEAQASADDWALEWNPATVTSKNPDGTDSGTPDVLDYEDAYDTFLENLNEMVTGAFGDGPELKIRATVGASVSQDKTKVDIITGNKAQDLIDTFFPHGDKVMRFRTGYEGKLQADVTLSGKGQSELYTFDSVDENEANASNIVIGRWEFFDKLLGKRKTFVELGSVRPKDYKTFFGFIGAVCGNRDIMAEGLRWINAQKHERLPGLVHWNIEFRGNDKTPILMVGDGKTAYALLFKANEVSIARSVGAKAQTIGRWTWEDRCSRLACAAVVIYLLRSLSAQINGEHQLTEE